MDAAKRLLIQKSRPLHSYQPLRPSQAQPFLYLNHIGPSNRLIKPLYPIPPKSQTLSSLLQHKPRSQLMLQVFLRSFYGKSPYALIEQILEDTQATLEAKTLLRHLQLAYPGKYHNGQLRTLQRRIKAWKACTARLKRFASHSTTNPVNGHVRTLRT